MGIVRPMNTKFASLSFELKQSTSGFQLFPAGQFTARDGRPKNVTAWEVKEKFFENLKARQTPIVIDYEHQTLEATKNGKAAPAAGWVEPLKVQRAMDGVFAIEPTWTVSARSMIAGDEYRYISPVFSYDPQTGEVLDLHSIALTNTPALDGMSPVALSFLLSPENNQMSPEILKLLGLADNADEAAAIAALKALKESNTQKETELAAAKAQTFDPSKFVPSEFVVGQTAEITQLKTQIAALTVKQSENEREQLIQANLPKLATPELQEWARTKISLEQLKAYFTRRP
jgi:phage I-like protein